MVYEQRAETTWGDEDCMTTVTITQTGVDCTPEGLLSQIQATLRGLGYTEDTLKKYFEDSL